MADHTGPIVGIDLGTTNSVIAAVKDGRPLVLEENGVKILPSVVGVTAEGKLVTGEVASNQLAAFPDRTIASIKRRMGEMEEVTLGDQAFTPPEISAMILRRLRDRASRALGEDVTRAVITVPAFFNESQRQATREAGELAGLQVERIINEPTAATLVYHAGSHDRKEIVVYDFGGGTFDVSIVRLEAGVIEVLSSKGDTKLGGDDIDEALLNHFADKFEEEHEIDLREDASSWHRLLQACREAKHRLSSEETAQVVVEFVADKEGMPLNIAESITRSELEELISPLIERTIQCVDDALQDAGLTINQIHDLVLVGGSTRMPVVARRLREEYSREPSRAVDPDLAVALGAALQAAMTQGAAVGPVLVDVTGHTLGIEVADLNFIGSSRSRFSPIIHRNSPLPARYENAYSTLHDDQKVVKIHVLQGENTEVHRNHSIGTFDLDLATGAENSKIVVRFDLSFDGTLNVTATQVATGKNKSLTIENELTQFRATDRNKAVERLSDMFQKSDELLDPANLPTVSQWAGEEQTQGDDAKFAEALKILEKAAAMLDQVDADDAQEIIELCEKLQRAMSAQDDKTALKIRNELDDILFYVQ